MFHEKFGGMEARGVVVGATQYYISFLYLILKDIKIDGSSISFDDSAVSRCIGDDPTIYRRYICNPWGLASCFPSFDVFHPQSNAEVTFEVVYDTGASTIE